MGWKSTIDIKRSEALGLIMQRLNNADNEQLADVLEALGYGDDTDLPYHGCNFMVVNDNDKYDSIYHNGEHIMGRKREGGYYGTARAKKLFEGE